ncbi:uncharacterized protein SOCG_04510 [Schizosaccharomyces octosporus yFS286]|uniref:Uncharacterized protein n=1 Tax=Schizosaccharomyces octosporus (strain yFS286) TaxID=483514 RepID=S9Q5D9_SCHOY|nr:uncharacterized protein SOCG_04510 [Schizosaccharomyces octosporus yFS286]EPX75267.1 hypothetical protein SOCG_04510 [Schizosaccharomyces octosporus yFS286]
MASDCFRWKTMNSLDLSQCLISDEQSRLLNTENANTNIDVCVTKQIEENSPDNTQIKEEEGVEFYSWSSSPNLNTNIPLLTHLDQQDLERLAEVEPVSASVLSENELIRKIDQQKKPNDTTTSISQPEIDFSRIVSSVETQRERSGHIQDQQGTPIQRFVEIPDGHISDGESKSKPPDTIELFDAQEDSEDDLAEVEELEIFPSLYNQKTERSHETRNINPKFSKEAENSIITNTPLNFEKSLDMSQHELRYLRRPISDYNFDLGIQNELTTIYEDYVKENERLRRVKKRRSQPSAQTSLEKTDSENAFLTFYKDWIRIAKHRKEKGNIKIQSKKEG